MKTQFNKLTCYIWSSVEVGLIVAIRKTWEFSYSILRWIFNFYIANLLLDGGC